MLEGLQLLAQFLRHTVAARLILGIGLVTEGGRLTVKGHRDMGGVGHIP